MSGYYTAIARFYDAEHVAKTDDLELYASLAEDYGSPILDVGSGTGRIVLHLAAEGHTVYGIERNQAMFAYAENKIVDNPFADHIHLHYGDVFSYEPKTQFSLILLTYNLLMHFHTQEEQLRLLKLLRQWVSDDGLVVFDLPNAGDAFGAQDTDALTLEHTFIDPETGHLIMLQSTSHIDRTTQMLRAMWIYDEVHGDGTVKRTFSPHILRYFFLPEMHLLLRLTGFTVEAVYGDMEGGAYEDGCERMIVYAKPV